MKNKKLLFVLLLFIPGTLMAQQPGDIGRPKYRDRETFSMQAPAFPVNSFRPNFSRLRFRLAQARPGIGIKRSQDFIKPLLVSVAHNYQNPNHG